MLAESDFHPDTEEEVRAAFSSFDKTDDGMLDLEEMRHVLTRVGDTMTPEETANFFSMIDNFGDGYARMDQLMELILPK